MEGSIYCIHDVYISHYECSKWESLRSISYNKAAIAAFCLYWIQSIVFHLHPLQKETGYISAHGYGHQKQ